MCDYSLYAIPNRLAEDGETVFLHRFGTGSIGFASVADVPPVQITSASKWQSICTGMKSFLLPRSRPTVPAVCMPPGSRLMVTSVPADLLRPHGFKPGDTVTTTEITSQSYTYRDGLVLPNGRCVLLQELPEGIQAVVLSTALEPVEDPTTAEVFARYR
jgi:hypothetical protein